MPSCAGWQPRLKPAGAEADAASGADPERDRAAFRDLATRQLELGAKAEDVSERALREQTLIKNKPADQQTPEEQMQAVQLDGVEEALHQAREQALQQAREQVREQVRDSRAAGNARSADAQNGMPCARSRCTS